MSNDDNAGIFNNDKIPERKSEISQEGSKVEVEEKLMKILMKALMKLQKTIAIL